MMVFMVLWLALERKNFTGGGCGGRMGGVEIECPKEKSHEQARPSHPERGQGLENKIILRRFL